MIGRKKDAPDAYSREYMIGLTDVLLGLMVALCNKGLFTRDEIAGMMTGMIDQQMQRDGGRAPVRRLAADGLRLFFSTPVARDWQARDDGA